MNILLINHYAGSPKHGMEYRPYYLAREWIKLGHQVRIIASSHSHLRQKQPLTKTATTFETIDGIEYLWLKTRIYQGNGLGRILNMFSFLKKLYTENKEIIKNFNPDIIIASSPHPFIFRGAKYLAKISSAKLIYEIRDLWPLSIIEILGVSKYHPLIMLMQHEENYAYKHADIVASLLPKAFSYMSQHGLNSNNFIYTPNGIVTDEWDSRNNDVLLESHVGKINKFKKKFKFLIGYAGGHGNANALSYLINAAKSIYNDSIGVILIGDGAQKKDLMIQVNQYKLDNVLFLDPVNKIMIPSFLEKMDALYIGWEARALYKYGISANKLFEYMICEKPIIHSIKAGNDPVKESGCGISCNPEDSKMIAKSIVKLSKKSSEDLKNMGRKGRKYVIKHHDYSVLAKDYLMSISSLLPVTEKKMVKCKNFNRV